MQKSHERDHHHKRHGNRIIVLDMAVRRAIHAEFAAGQNREDPPLDAKEGYAHHEYPKEDSNLLLGSHASERDKCHQ